MTEPLTTALSPSPIRAGTRLRTPLAAGAAISSVTQRQWMLLGRWTAELGSHACLRSNRWSGGAEPLAGRAHSTAFDRSPKSEAAEKAHRSSIGLSLSYSVMVTFFIGPARERQRDSVRPGHCGVVNASPAV